MCLYKGCLRDCTTNDSDYAIHCHGSVTHVGSLLAVNHRQSLAKDNLAAHISSFCSLSCVLSYE